MKNKPTSVPRVKKTKADFLREWNLPYPSFKYDHLRYKAPPEKGVYWYWFSRDVRQRDVEKWGTCISCNRPITVDTSQAGHFMPARDSGLDLLFHQQNVNAECEKCNAWDDTHLLGYAENLDKRYGSGTAAKLRLIRAAYLTSKAPRKDLRGHQYAQMVRDLSSYQQSVPSGFTVKA